MARKGARWCWCLASLSCLRIPLRNRCSPPRTRYHWDNKFLYSFSFPALQFSAFQFIAAQFSRLFSHSWTLFAISVFLFSDLLLFKIICTFSYRFLQHALSITTNVSSFEELGEKVSRSFWHRLFDLWNQFPLRTNFDELVYFFLNHFLNFHFLLKIFFCASIHINVDDARQLSKSLSLNFLSCSKKISFELLYPSLYPI